MTESTPISRRAFDEAASKLGIEGSEAHMDELYLQVRGVLAGAESLRAINVGDVEPDMAFDPTGGKRS